MRKSALFVLFILFISNSVFGQTEKTITISFDNKDLKEAILQLEDSTDTQFFFQEEWLKGQTVSGNFNDVPLRSILDAILQNTSLNYLIRGNQVIILNNLLVYDTLPDNYFNEGTNNSDGTIPPIFQEQYSGMDNKDINKVESIGRQKSQDKATSYTLSGVLKNSKTGEPISDMTISTADRKFYATTNASGYYKINLPAGLNTLETSLIGYERKIREVVVYGDGNLNMSVVENTEMLGEVVIESNKNENVRAAALGVTSIDIEKIKEIPLVLGERDMFKVATTLPGITTAGEGAQGYNVRGGRADQNLILLDEGVIYTPSHFLGFFSAINPFTTESLDIYKASIPAEYGGRLSSVFDIESKDGNFNKISGEGSIGPITGNLSLEVPVIEDKASLIVGGRATYSGYILRSLDEPSLKNSEASFYDAIAKYKHKFNANNSVQGTVYYSNDKFSITSDSIYKYSNRLVSLQWAHNFNEKSRANLILVNSKYNYNILFDGDQNNDFDFGYEINETQVKLNLNYALSEKHKFTYGLSSKLYGIDPGTIKPTSENSDIALQKSDREQGLESALYFADLYKVNEKILFDLGIRYSFYAALGEATQNVYEDNAPKSAGTVKEVKTYGNNEIIKTYGGPEFRLSGRYLFTPSLSIKAGYNRTIQYIHLLSTNTTISPTDIYKLSDLNIEPQRADQYSVGLFKNIEEKDLEFSLEGYYKQMDNILDYKTGAQLILNENLETELLNGEGRAYGIEFLARKNKGRLNGYFGYTYSRSEIKLNSEIQSERVNNGAYFPANYDKPHDFSLVGNYKLTKRYSISSNFVYQTGRPVTYPVGRFIFAGEEQVVYSDRNEFRIPDYYRLDIGVNIEGNHKKNKLAHSFINISVYNVLGRNNPYSVFFVNDDGKIKALKTSIFSVPVPTITYNFKF